MRTSPKPWGAGVKKIVPKLSKLAAPVAPKPLVPKPEPELAELPKLTVPALEVPELAVPDAQNPPDSKWTEEALEEFSMSELREVGHSLGISGRSKAVLVQAILDAQ